MGINQSTPMVDVIPIVENLSDGQKSCLRLVMGHNSSKEIARKLGISPHTVDKRVKQAIAKLGVNTRVDAARILQAYENGTPNTGYQSLVYPSSDLSSHDLDGNMHLSSGKRDQADGEVDMMLHEAQASFESRSNWNSENHFLRLVSGSENQANNLTVQARILAMLAIAFGSIMVFALFVSVLEGLSRLY